MVVIWGRSLIDLKEWLRPDVVYVADAFAHARDLISGWEKEEKREPSEPQIATTPMVEKKLAEWHGELARNAKGVLIGTAPH
jgi:hypothetical protein